MKIRVTQVTTHTIQSSLNVIDNNHVSFTLKQTNVHHLERNIVSSNMKIFET